MPVLPASLFEPVWVQFSAVLPERPRVVLTHPLGCHRSRIPDRRVFEHVVAALVHGSGDERIATPGCADRTIRRRLREWAELGRGEEVHLFSLQASERMIGLDLEDLAADGCLTKAPGGGEVAGRSPVDRGTQGLKGSVLTEGGGIPLHLVPAGANRHDALLLPATLAGLDKVGEVTAQEPGTMHLDRGYAGTPTRVLLDELGLAGDIARQGVAAPRQAGSRWTVETTQSQYP
jgi:hypothetical protein